MESSGGIRVLALAISVGLGSTAAAAATQSRPNVLLILLDNTGWGDFGCYGGGELRGAPSPRIDRLASEGMLLQNFNTEPQYTPSHTTRACNTR
jgi:arylsulfatase